MKNSVTAVEWLPRGERFLLVATKTASLRLFDTRDKKTVWELGPDTCHVLKDQRQVDGSVVVYLVFLRDIEFVLLCFLRVLKLRLINNSF